MQCDFCRNEFTQGGYVWHHHQWCDTRHIEPRAGSGSPYFCHQCATSLRKKEIIETLMKRHPVHQHAVASIITRCRQEGYGITFSNQEIDDLLGLKRPAHHDREAREAYKKARQLGLDNIKRDLLYNHKLLFTGTPTSKNALGAWWVRQY